MYTKVKLTRAQARRGKVPFSLFYLFPRREIEDFRQVFETFLGFPARQSSIRWRDIRIDELNGESNESFLTDVVADIMNPAADVQVAVPILSVHKSMPKGMPPRGSALDLYGLLELYKQADPDGPRPAFLTTEAWKNWKATVRGPVAQNLAYPPVSYLVTRDEIYIPPCLACPRIGYHEAGECQLGDSVCYDALRNYNASATMYNRLHEFDDIQESIDVLPPDDSPQVTQPNAASRPEDQTD